MEAKRSKYKEHGKLFGKRNESIGKNKNTYSLNFIHITSIKNNLTLSTLKIKSESNQLAILPLTSSYILSNHI